MRVPVVDDNPDDRLLIIRELRRELPDAVAVEIGNGEAFAEALVAGNSDLAVTDYQLNWSDGVAVFRRIREDRADCPVIMFTATGNEEIAVEAMKAGLDDYIIKSPRRLTRLRASVRSALERAQARQQLRETETRLQDLFQTAPVGLCRFTEDGIWLDANPSLLDMLGAADRVAFDESRVTDVFGSRKAFDDAVREALAGTAVEVPLHRYDGETLWVMMRARPASPDGQGVLDCAFTNITGLKLAHQRGEDLLREKPALLEELYHRVNNNLQLVTTFIARTRVAVSVEAEPLNLPLALAVPLALIANELILNALKHAFFDIAEPTLQVRLSIEAPGRGVLVVRDNGVGGDITMPSGQGYGSRLIQSLTRQTGATIEMDGTNGLAVKVAFSLDSRRPSA